MYDSSTRLTQNTLNLIASGYALAIYGRTHDGRAITAVRNVSPDSESVTRAIATAEGYGMTNLQVMAD